MRKYLRWLAQPKHRKQLAAIVMAVLFFTFTAAAYATVPDTVGKDPLQTINALSDFIFAAIRAIGVILLLFGVVQIGMSLKSHDPSQRSNGFLTFFGGLVIALAKEVLDLILK